MPRGTSKRSPKSTKKTKRKPKKTLESRKIPGGTIERGPRGGGVAFQTTLKSLRSGKMESLIVTAGGKSGPVVKSTKTKVNKKSRKLKPTTQAERTRLRSKASSSHPALRRSRKK